MAETTPEVSDRRLFFQGFRWGLLLLCVLALVLVVRRRPGLRDLFRASRGPSVGTVVARRAKERPGP